MIVSSNWRPYFHIHSFKRTATISSRMAPFISSRVLGPCSNTSTFRKFHKKNSQGVKSEERAGQFMSPPRTHIKRLGNISGSTFIDSFVAWSEAPSGWNQSSSSWKFSPSFRLGSQNDINMWTWRSDVMVVDVTIGRDGNGNIIISNK